jgi:hypothetical protein
MGRLCSASRRMACFLPSPPTEANSDFAEGGEGGRGTNFIACRRGRGTSLIDGRGIVPVDKTQKWHWRSVAIQSQLEAIKLSRCIGALLRADARSAHRSGAKVGVRVQWLLRICLGYRSKSKKCDKPINYTVRVGFSFYLIFLFTSKNPSPTKIYPNYHFYYSYCLRNCINSEIAYFPAFHQC